MAENKIISGSEKRKLKDTMTGQSTDQRIDDLLDKLRATVKSDGAVFGWFIDILRGTKRTETLADTLLAKYNELDKN